MRSSFFLFFKEKKKEEEGGYKNGKEEETEIERGNWKKKRQHIHPRIIVSIN